MKKLILMLCVSVCFSQTVSIYYYPWYIKSDYRPTLDLRWGQNLREALDLKQPPLLGHYTQRDSQIILQHIEWSENYGIHNWVCSWWGDRTHHREDSILYNIIAPAMEGTNLTYALFYEVWWLLGHEGGQVVFDSAAIELNRYYFNLMAKHFDHPNYRKIDGRPVVFSYITRGFTGQFKESFDLVRQDMMALGHDIYLVGDELYWSDLDPDHASYLDAVTAYNMHRGNMYGGYPGETDFITDVDEAFARGLSQAQAAGLNFIPSAMPGFNDRAVRLEEDHPIITPKFLPGDNYTSTFKKSLEVCQKNIDPALNECIITSFNEWFEDTQIEPTIRTLPTTGDTLNGELTLGYEYQGYGGDLLQEVLDLFGTNADVPPQLTILGPETISVGGYTNLTWNTQGKLAKVSLSYLQNGTWNAIAEMIPNTGQFSWLTPFSVSGTVTLRVSSIEGNFFAEKIYSGGDLVAVQGIEVNELDIITDGKFLTMNLTPGIKNISVYNTQGALLFHQDNSTNRILRIPRSNYKKGVYLIKISGETVGRIVKALF